MSRPSEYLKLERQIVVNERGGLLHRWRYGRALLKAKEGRKQLPHGLAAQLVAEADLVAYRDKYRHMHDGFAKTLDAIERTVAELLSITSDESENAVDAWKRGCGS